MLTIRHEQLQAFVAARRREFEEQLTEHLLKEFEEELKSTLGTLDGGAVGALVSKGIDSALEYGIDDEDDITSLVEIQAERGSGFETRPGFEWAASILSNPKLTSKVKIDLLIDGLSETAS